MRRVTSTLKRQAHAGRCPKCSRILFLTDENKLPPHRTPPRKPPNRGAGATATIPLTGRDALWCKGVG